MPGLLDVPTKVALPAAAAAAAYLNAKYSISWDLWTIWKFIGGFGVYIKMQEKKDRINIFYVLEGLALDPKTKDRIFLIIPEDEETTGQKREWTYAEAYELILKHAAWLKYKQHVQRHEVIAMDFTNRPQFVWNWFALWSLGAIPALINHNLRGDAFVHCVRISGSRLLLMEARLEETLTEEVVTGLSADEKGRAVETVVYTDDIVDEILAQTPYRESDEARSGAGTMSTSLLIYTSGTTGLPKAVNVQWAKVWGGLKWHSVLMGIKPDDRYLTALPLYHSSGSVLGVLQVLNTGAAVVVVPRFSPRTFMKYVHETKATGIHYIGELCRYLLVSPATPYDKDHNVRFAYGNGLRPDVWNRFKEKFNIPTIVEFYGATEGVGASFSHSRNDYLRGVIGREGAIMKLLSPYIIVKHDSETDMPYRDPKTGLCVKCKPDEPGELLSKMNPDDLYSNYLGYWGNEKATMSKVLRNVIKKGDAWYRSGDLQRQDADGRVYFCDRVGDTFRWKAENVSTAEVSQAVGTHPNVSEANVYGVELPSHDGRAGCAAIVLGGRKWDDALAKDLADHARKQLPQYAVPIFLRLMPRVEVTGTMKHQKVALRKEGVDPSVVQGDEIYWLERGADRYVRLDDQGWKRIVDGSARL